MPEKELVVSETETFESEKEFQGVKTTKRKSQLVSNVSKLSCYN
jgi:hypothetical protein